MSLIPLGFWAASGGGGGASSFDLLETQTLASSAASVTFTGLGSYSDYKHLQIRWIAKSSKTSDLAASDLTLNGDTGSSYANHYLLARPTSSFISSSDPIPSTRIARSNIAGSTSSDDFSSGVYEILDFSSTDKNTTLRGLDGSVAVGSGGANRFFFRSGLYNSTSAITSITFTNDGDNYIAGSRFSLIGIK